MPLTSINIYTLKQIRTKRHRYDLDAAPSRDDIYLTHKLQEAGKIMGIELLDHVITGEQSYVSLKEKGFL